VHAHFTRHIPATLHLLHDARGQLYQQLSALSRVATVRGVSVNDNMGRLTTASLTLRSATEFTKAVMTIMRGIKLINADIDAFHASHAHSIEVPGDDDDLPGRAATGAGKEGDA